MKTTYIQFDAPKSNSQTAKDGLIKSLLKKALVGILTTIIPKANPDFDDKIDEVQYWLVECNNETGIPEREIGLDKAGRVILKMPFKDNYGYWTDNNLLLNDFKEHFVVSEISKDSFEQSWELFDKISNFEIEIADFQTLSTGADGGHIYLTTEIKYKGQLRTLVIYFADNSDEQKVRTKDKLKLSGRLFDEGVQQSLSLLDTKLID
ncbi:hypothetical protein FQU23_015905 [Flavobacterium sp. XN-5]|uniref:hypothetical protein n=1 Tax=Flavobacterium sp. XN-5 TaxID=2599390 RepID=UPI0011CC6D3D|nr:hypothetical protein [Flavobacterium sp. XN-5]NGY38982.1 hypothetical protein [Flavobacterium sp. XN-5]